MRSFGGSSGMGWRGAGSGSGGGAGGGGGLFRTVSRVARAGISNLQDPSSPSSSSSSSSPRNTSKRGLTLCHTTAAIAPSLVSLSTSIQGFGPSRPLTSSSSLCDESEWVDVNDEFSIEDGNDSFDDRIFGSVPSSHEVTTALLSLQQAVPTSCSSDVDWIEPSSHMYGYDHRINPGIGRVYEALHLLQTDSSVQRMVISLSSDRSVWAAVLNNEAVQELRGAFYRGEADDSESSDEESEPVSSSSNVVKWIFNNMRSKFMEFLSGITNLVKDAFEPEEHEQQTTDEFPDVFREKVRAAFMLTAIVLLIVVVSRASHD
ncbi:hypothetical protein V2J09_021136 [Rumex salicifolius]